MLIPHISEQTLQTKDSSLLSQVRQHRNSENKRVQKDVNRFYSKVLCATYGSPLRDPASDQRGPAPVSGTQSSPQLWLQDSGPQEWPRPLFLAASLWPRRPQACGGQRSVSSNRGSWQSSARSRSSKTCCLKLHTCRHIPYPYLGGLPYFGLWIPFWALDPRTVKSGTPRKGYRMSPRLEWLLRAVDKSRA